MIGVLGAALLVTSIGCSTPLHTREKGALIVVAAPVPALARSLVAGQAPQSEAQ